MGKIFSKLIGLVVAHYTVIWFFGDESNMLVLKVES